MPPAKLKLRSELPECLHFVGIGGIGMSGLAQMLNADGHQISGSDRALSNPENHNLFESLREQGIRLFPQDGSFASETSTEALIWSSAIEEDNPDFAAAAGMPRVHRSEALALTINRAANPYSIAVTGTCGKTTVTAWLAESLILLGLDPAVLCGGMVNAFRDKSFPGNFRPGSGPLVFEADESDKSLLAYHPEYCLILNLGTDHYSEDELLRLFTDFLSQTTVAAAVDIKFQAQIQVRSENAFPLISFGEESDKRADIRVSYLPGSAAVSAKFADSTTSFRLPIPGRHNALNAAAVRAVLDLLPETSDLPPARKEAVISGFHGVHRRFEFCGKTATGVAVYDDYAHNVEKISAAICTAREISQGRTITFFQPHGFGPFGFMRDKLLPVLEDSLGTDDIFCFLPVFYAGGSSSFSPDAAEVAAEYQQRGRRQYRFYPSRESAEKFITEQTTGGDIILVLGARDNSLSNWAHTISCTIGKQNLL